MHPLVLQLGDFNGDAALDANDIDLLGSAIRANSQDLAFDSNQDGMVTNADHGFWVTKLRKTYFGDINLDGQFDARDLTDCSIS